MNKVVKLTANKILTGPTRTHEYVEMRFPDFVSPIAIYEYRGDINITLTADVLNKIIRCGKKNNWNKFQVYANLEIPDGAKKDSKIYRNTKLILKWLMKNETSDIFRETPKPLIDLTRVVTPAETVTISKEFYDNLIADASVETLRRELLLR